MDNEWYLIEVYGEVIMCQDCSLNGPEIPFLSGGNLEHGNRMAYISVPNESNTCWYHKKLYGAWGEKLLAKAKCPKHLEKLLAAAVTLRKASCSDLSLKASRL